MSSIFFGGGTPSLFSAVSIGAILDGAAARLRLHPGLEVTLETNPGTVEHDRFEAYRSAGVNRLSFGVQSFDDGCLSRLGRIHDSAQAERAIKLAQDAGLDNLNIDLMFALPGQDLAMAEHDVERALALSPTHLSHYQLTLEPNTLFHARPPAGLPGDDLAWDMQEACQAQLAAAGFAQYEVSAYARPGRQCQHNLNYWRFGDYLGIGAGAHGKLSVPAEAAIRRRWKLKHPARYMVEAGRAGSLGGDDSIPTERLAFEFMLNALRLNQGFQVAQFEARTGLAWSSQRERFDQAQQRGWLQQQADWVCATELGGRFLNDVLELFLPVEAGQRSGA